ncbi:hypothetical protein BESB_016530 [Besnoitia besnoiti]|uniref:Uncharacterized protein n=1 Tax=Besnoitia besnoiti TaxID=94643 RepID=A0A2A9M303_BESBE|nr:hypothetical protein BESB_016530 [Besnoitia besnoiti]PFH32335.1 hypothetical protein BESB_016530 [Besnoitia besnoiti]
MVDISNTRSLAGSGEREGNRDSLKVKLEEDPSHTDTLPVFPAHYLLKPSVPAREDDGEARVGERFSGESWEDEGLPHMTANGVISQDACGKEGQERIVSETGNISSNERELASPCKIPGAEPIGSGEPGAPELPQEVLRLLSNQRVPAAVASMELQTEESKAQVRHAAGALVAMADASDAGTNNSRQSGNAANFPAGPTARESLNEAAVDGMRAEDPHFLVEEKCRNRIKSPIILCRSTRASLVDSRQLRRHASLLAQFQTELEGVGLNTSEAVKHRRSFPRFLKIFGNQMDPEKHLFPFPFFLKAAQLGPTDRVNGRVYTYSGKLLHFRDELLREFIRAKEINHLVVCNKLRSLPESRASRPLPTRAMQASEGLGMDTDEGGTEFLQRWFAFEVRYLYEREHIAIRALKPLVDCILSLECLMISEKKEVSLAPPQNRQQALCTIRCMQSFCACLSGLAQDTLQDTKRVELIHEPEVIVLASVILWKEKCEREANKSNQDLFPAKAAKAELFDVDYHNHASVLNAHAEDIAYMALNKKAVARCHDLIVSFKKLRDVIWARRECLDYMEPHFAQDGALIHSVRAFEVAYHHCKRLILRPCNLI